MSYLSDLALGVLTIWLVVKAVVSGWIEKRPSSMEASTASIRRTVGQLDVAILILIAVAYVVGIPLKISDERQDTRTQQQILTRLSAIEKLLTAPKP